MTDREGQRFGSYHIIQFLGRGNFAEVYLGRHIHLHTLAAIKVLRGQLAEHDRENFLIEARTIARLHHPHIIQVLDYGVEDATPFLVMDYAPGGNLRQRHPRGARLPLATIVSYVKQIAEALQYAHDEKVIHRDIKPENMLLGRNQEILLSDFGIAIMAQSSLSQPSQNTAGTIAYMAPEQLQAHPDFASDQYALGVIVYEWLSGDSPFSGTVSEIAIKHTLIAPPSLREQIHSIPLAVEEVVLKTLAKQPRQRFKRVLAFAQALEEAARTESPQQTLPDLSAHALTALESLTGRERQWQETPAESSSNPPPLHYLPSPLTRLVGREQEVGAVATLLQRPDVRLVTLSGPGGVGKTRLGLQVATELQDQFPDGVYFVSLASIHDASLVIPTIAPVLGIHEAREQSLLEKLKGSLRVRRLLLLLDNFEQVVGAAPSLTEILLACPHLKMLVTSRALLHVHGEHEFTVPPLAVPNLANLPDCDSLHRYSAIDLFLQRAKAIKPDFAITGANARAIVDICARLDGLPLALELAAARIKMLSPEALHQRLSQQRQLAVLTSGAQDVPVRQQTLRNTVEWSYNLLDTTEQQLFRRLSVFSGGCTLEAVEFLCLTFADDGEEALDRVTSLIDKSLLLQTERQDNEPRIHMLAIIREYAIECLATSGEEERARHAHAAYYVSLAEQAEPEFGGPTQALWLARLAREHENLRAAMDWLLQAGEEDKKRAQIPVKSAMALRLGGALRRFWVVRGHLREGRTFLEHAIAQDSGVPTSVRAKALIAAATLAIIQIDYDQVETLCQESLALFRQLGDASGIALSLYLLGVVPWSRGDAAAARPPTEEALALFRQMGEQERIAWSLFTLASIDSSQGEYARAKDLFEESLAIHQQLGNKRGIASALSHLAQAQYASRISSDQAQTTVRTLLEEAMALFTDLGDKEGIAYSLALYGQLALDQHEVSAARKLAGESLSLYREMGHQQGTGEALAQFAHIVAHAGESMAAQALYEESLEIFRETGRKEWIATCLEGLAGVLAAHGDAVQAARLLGCAEALRGAVGMPLPPAARADYEQAVTAVRTQLGEKKFAAAWAIGRTLTSVEALLMGIVSPSSEREIITPTPEMPALHSPAGLTPREVEVLRLMTMGLTNPQIAGQLTISPVTVNSHVRSIYNKLDVTSRSAATRYAIEHKLA